MSAFTPLASNALAHTVGAMDRHLHLAPDPPPAKPEQTGAAPVRVVLLEHHALMRRSLALLLAHDPVVELIAEAHDLRSAVTKVLEDQPDVLVLDLGSLDGSGLRAIGELRERVPDTQIVALSMNDDPVFARGALAAGAHGFVLKQLADGELAPAVDAAAHGEVYVSPRVARRLPKPHPWGVEDEPPRAASQRAG
jgi:two-component system, NarL family, response regulator NreC